MGPIILVENIQRSRQFYGTTLRQKVKYDFGVNVSFEGDFAIHLKSHFAEITHMNHSQSIIMGSNSFDLCFETEIIDEIFHELQRINTRFLNGIEEQPWGQRVLRCYDPDGHLVEIGETMEAVVIRYYQQGKTMDEILNKTAMPKEFVEGTISQIIVEHSLNTSPDGPKVKEEAVKYGCDQVKPRKYNYGDYLTWPEAERWEIFDGVPEMMAPPSRIHQEILAELFTQFHGHFREKLCKVYPAPFGVRLPAGDETFDEEITTIVEPDIVVVCDTSKLDDQGCKGAPDLIVEIVSPASVKHDKITKFNLYERFGVKEYWIVEPIEKLLTVFSLGENGRYGRPEVYAEDNEINVHGWNDFTIRLKPVFDCR